MTALVLTILLAVLWVGLIAVGFWHGGWRQVVVLAAMLLSYAVASEWAAPNGHDLSQQFHWNPARTTTAVGLLYLLGGTLLIGFLGSFALPRPSPLALGERALGAVMGFLNGGLMLALVLRTLRSYAFLAGNGQVLRNSALSRFLIESIGYVLIVALALGVIAAIIGLFLVRRGVRTEAPLVDWPRPQVDPIPPQPHYANAAPAAVPMMASNYPLPSPVAPVVMEPVFASAPIIDWPSSPPPGVHEEPVVSAMPAVQPAPVALTLSEETRSYLPIAPVLPRRVDPPMLYPIAQLMRVPTLPAAPSALTPMPPPVSTAPVHEASPAAEMPPPPQARPRPTTPPPGALQPAFVPLNLPRASDPASAPRLPEPIPAAPTPAAPQPPTEAGPPDLRARDIVTDDAPPPVVRELDVATDGALPVVREVDVTTRDAPVVAAASPASSPLPIPAAPLPTVEGDRVQTPISVPPVPKVTETAPFSAVEPPPLPSAPLPRLPDMPGAASSDARSPLGSEQSPSPEAPKTRPGFARVAVARQASANVEQPSQPPPSPPSQPSTPQPPQSDPSQPPLPTGPRVHACPVCGYPVRDHARYCPNCGSRQRS